MRFNIENLFERCNYDETQKSYFSGFNIVDVAYRKAKDLTILKAENDGLLPIDEYNDLLNYFKELGLFNVKLLFKLKNKSASLLDVNHYLKAYAAEHNEHFDNAILNIENDVFVLSYINEEDKEKDEEDIDNLKLFFYDMGLKNEIVFKMHEEDNTHSETREALKVEDKPKVIENPSFSNNYNKKEGGYQYKPKAKNYTEVTISELTDNMFDVKFTGQIFKVEEFVTRAGMTIQTMYIKDAEDALIAKMMENKRNTKEVLALNKEGKWAVFSGNYRYDNYSNDYVFDPVKIDFCDDPNPIKDDEERKRVELHVHSKLSEMDGVSSPTELVKTAFKMGHRAMALTDHMCLQGFHETQMAYLGCMKPFKDKEEKPDFKII